MDNIVVKDANGTTDITYYVVQRSGGDRSPARWRTDLGGSFLTKPILEFTSRDNGTKTGRRLDVKFDYPEVFNVSTDGSQRVANRFIMNLSIIVPQGMSSTNIDHATFQGLRLLGSDVMAYAVRSGYAPS